MRRWCMPVISRHGISEWAAWVAVDILPAASPTISNDRMTAFWCSRLARKATSSSPSTNDRASRAASSISSKRAESRSGNSAIDRFDLVQDRPPPDEVPTFLNGLALDQVDGAPKQRLQRVLQIGEGRKIVSSGGRESHEEISVTAFGIETGAASSRTEDLEPRHAKAAAERRKSLAPAVDVGPHGFLPSLRNA